MGDPAGVGPEIVAKSCRSLQGYFVDESVEVLVFGRRKFWEQAISLVSGESVGVELANVEFVEVGSSVADHVARGKVSSAGGQAAVDALVAATDMALAHQVDAIVTAPLHKESLHAAGVDFPGHTELLAHYCGVEQVAMMLHLSRFDKNQTDDRFDSATGVSSPFSLGDIGLSVVHVTLHTALRKVFDELTHAAIVSKTHLINEFCQKLLDAKGILRKPRIAVAALNPHGGEGGLFGDEETTTIRPAVSVCQAEGLSVVGPEPVDTLIRRAAMGEFDGVVAMYHDQGHIALKLLDMFATVNITLGLPIIRTSVAHGTAFEIAWQGIANCQSLNQAIQVAVKLARYPSAQ